MKSLYNNSSKYGEPCNSMSRVIYKQFNRITLQAQKTDTDTSSEPPNNFISMTTTY